MGDALSALILLGSLLAGLVMPVWAFIHLGRRAVSGERTRAGACLRYLGWAFLPAGAAVGVFLLLIGVEELTGAAIIAEGLARTLPLLVGLQVALALLGTLAFAVRLAFLPRASRAVGSRLESRGGRSDSST